MNDFLKIHLAELFQKVPTSSMPKYLLLGIVVFGASLLVATFIIKFIRRKTDNKTLKKILRELPAGLSSFGVISLVLIWMRLESVPFFAMRLWWVFFWIAFVWWLIVKIRKILKIKKRIERAKKS